jgi:hypothetical protein
LPGSGQGVFVLEAGGGAGVHFGSFKVFSVVA